MASISPLPSRHLSFSTTNFHSPTPFLKPHSSAASPSPSSHSHTICHSHNPDSPPSEPSLPWGWSSALQGLFQTAIERFDSLVTHRSDGSIDPRSDGRVLQGRRKDGDDDYGSWDWDRWRKHFDEVDEQEHLVSFLKSRLSHAVYAEDYEDAARLKVALAALATKDTVGRAMSHLHRAIEEERYRDAAFIRDNAGAGLVGWWSGTSKDDHNPRGLIIRITAEHGRYIARSYSSRQLATAADGVPLFEIFLGMNKKGEYKQQAVYLKRKGDFSNSSNGSSKELDSPSLLNPFDPVEEKDDIFIIDGEEAEDGDIRNEDSDIAVGLPVFQDILRDMIPGGKVKVLKLTTSGKVDKDVISKVIEQIIEEEEDEEEEDDEEEEEEDDGESEKESGFEDLEVEDKIKDERQENAELIADDGFLENQGQNEVAVKIIVGGLAQKLSGGFSAKNILRVPAKLEKKGRSSFSFSIVKDSNEQDSIGKELNSMDRMSKSRGRSSNDYVMLDLAKLIGKEKIPLKVLKNLSELIKLSISQAQNCQPLSGSTSFNRIDIPTTSDPLNGLYIGAHGMYTSDIIHLRRRFGRWQEDGGGDKEPSKLEFYEYVEAWKVIGDPYVPAGKVAFRAKVGKKYQLPHKGIIPEEFGVIARYKGQGRLAEPGFRNPRWVDGELVILDGKHIKGGPAVGFIYWAPEFQFLVFFNRLRLQE
ncbi:protein EXECUTER 1, chloroplastic-like [Cucurbita moschata]|uniref:Protein EXECUTER 1, chloroplastic-like n=1 Tax=Cucurbita moschata TaxID=3662 RepID=A0A6J1EIZ2_CUCMO|nr:protein EXECUTER 1, chloroplastic-like [Cucurbita moschata]XP_022927783.1 protein EXECUTER 1, chloroplastic-like [Cucurbita moschata]XP_022927784.1 protein EXECUTER 1, chloroplastic-like [Cucurbita moschata]XP_022927785.1 protein EXECUTER 1, chloroplastic-like [Cucurbita moschata]XP_022927786.1 protein EXECUTER 1, chloroplastic-like [Cucurbita moschata]XP_022927788.1 protein EXECUTER 1, chloroplastic-like [Cucurbita moschata]